MALFSSIKSSYLAWSNSTPLPSSDLRDASPTFQNWHLHEAESGWTIIELPKASHTSISASTSVPETLELATWNVDAFGPDPEARLNGIFTSLQSLETGSPDVILLQEVSLKALNFLLSNSWIREHYVSSEADGTNWDGVPFASLTLLSRSRFNLDWLSRCDSRMAKNLGPVWRVKYPSRFTRDALCCDIILRGGSRIRLINVHLDSLNINPSHRPRQVAVAASLLRVAGVDCGVVAGDFNPVSESDASLVAENGLSDAWELLRPGEDGFTWGLNGEGSPFPPGRLDKVVFYGEGLAPQRIEVLAAPNIRKGQADASDAEPEGPVARCSDHCGIICFFRLA